MVYKFQLRHQRRKKFDRLRERERSKTYECFVFIRFYMTGVKGGGGGKSSIE